jgi:hypothetical protein
MACVAALGDRLELLGHLHVGLLGLLLLASRLLGGLAISLCVMMVAV